MARKNQLKSKSGRNSSGLFGTAKSSGRKNRMLTPPPAKAASDRSDRKESSASGVQPNYLFNLISLVLCILSVALMAALASGFSVGTSSRPPPNVLGAVGQTVSRSLFSTFGAASFALPICLAFFSLKLFTAKIPSLRILQWLGLALTILGAMVMGHLFAGEIAGGLVGAVVAESLKSLVASFGTGLVAVLLIVGGLLLLTQGALAIWAKTLGILIVAGISIAAEAFIDFCCWAKTELSEQFDNWRAERAEESERSNREAAELEAAENERLAALMAESGANPSAPPSSAPSRLVLDSQIPASAIPFSSAPAAAAAPASEAPSPAEKSADSAGQTPSSSSSSASTSAQPSEPVIVGWNTAKNDGAAPKEEDRQESSSPKTPVPAPSRHEEAPAETKEKDAPSLRSSLKTVGEPAWAAARKTREAPAPAASPEPAAATAAQPASPAAVNAEADDDDEDFFRKSPAEIRADIARSEQKTEIEHPAWPDAAPDASPETSPETSPGVSPGSSNDVVPQEAPAVQPAPADEAAGDGANADAASDQEDGGLLICDPIRLPRLTDPPSAVPVHAEGLDEGLEDEADIGDGLPGMQPAPAPDAARPSAGGEEGADDGDAQEQEEEKEEVRDPFIFRRTFELPSLDLLSEPDRNAVQREDADFYKQTAARLTEKLRIFHIPGEVKRIVPGPVVTRYEFKPGDGIKVSKIAGLGADLAMAMEALSVRIIAPIPGRDVVGFEVPNKKREMICLREIFEQQDFQHAKSKLTFAIGKNVEGLPYMTDLAKMPHLLIAGTTGSGKSVTVNTMIMSLLYRATPEEVRLIMVDPKVTELSIYDGIPHLLLPVVTEPKKAAMALQWAVDEMERRYQLLAGASVRNIAGYNAWVEKRCAELEEERREAEAAECALRAADRAKAKAEEAARQAAAAPTPLQENPGGEAVTLPPTAADFDASSAKTEPPGPALPPTEENDASSAKTEPPTPAGQAAQDAVEDEEEDRRIDEIALELDARDAYEAKIAKFLEDKAKEPPRKLPYIVIVIDEVADLMMVVRKEVETHVARLAQKARAAGIHLMMATQRPSADVITGVIKANFPSRISCQLRSWQDSMTILGTKGAEALLGMGDMLILPPDSPNLTRVHGAFVSDEEISDVVAFLKTQGEPNYLDESVLRRPEEEDDGGSGQDSGSSDRDPMYDTVLAMVCEMKTVSTSMIQRKLKLGYNRAARIIDQLERDGVVGPANGSKPREVLAPPLDHYRDVNL